MAGNVISFQKEKRLSFGVLVAEVARFEGSCHILLYGGAKPHIGCTVLAQPRPSLADTRKRSSTACVLNVAGHKDEVLCRHVAETVAAGSGLVTVCSGGFHEDQICAARLEEVQAAARQLAAEICQEINWPV